MAEGSNRTVIIGAGVAGMAAAIRTAAQGHRVTVLEAAEEPGGKLREQTTVGTDSMSDRRSSPGPNWSLNSTPSPVRKRRLVPTSPHPSRTNHWTDRPITFGRTVSG